MLTALGDPVSLGLLTALSRSALDAHSLVVETGFPQSSVYRKLRELAENRLVRTQRLAFTPEGRKVELFASALREVRVRFDLGRLRLDVVAREDSSERLSALWDVVQRYGR